MSGRTLGRTQLLVAFALFALAPLVLLVALPLRLSTTALQAEATSRVVDASSAGADTIGRRIDALADRTAGYAEQISPTVDQASLERILTDLQQADPEITSTALMSAQGTVLAASPANPSHIGADYSFRDYFKGALESQQPYVSEVFSYNGETGKRKLIGIAQAIRTTAGDGGPDVVTGVLVSIVDVMATMQSYVDELVRANGAQLEIIDQHGRVVASPGLTQDIPIADDPRVAQQGSVSTRWVGMHTVPTGKVLSSYIPVPGLGWTVAASMPESAANSSVQELRQGVSLVAAVLGAFVFVGFVLLARAWRGRDRAELAMRANEERTRVIVETAAQGFIEASNAGIITEWNLRAEQLFGWRREEVVGKHLRHTIVTNESSTRFFLLFDHVMGGLPSTESVRVESTAQHKDSFEQVQVEYTMWRTIVGGLERFNVLVTDIADRKRLEADRELIVKRQLRLVEELRQADKVKSDFVSTVSHELRTPLTSIMGYLELLNEGYGGTLQDKQVQMLEVVDRNSRRLLDLIEDMLMLSRIESGAFEIERAEVDVTALAVGVQQALLPSAANKAIDLTVDIGVDIGSINGDSNQLERALLNLVSNAIKFTPEGGRVSVNGYRGEDGVVHLSVSDTGIGIPVEEQHKLFNRFFRSTNAQDAAIQGTGLGLAIVKSIVEHHGGSVWVQSAVNAGTTIYIDLPGAKNAQLLSV